MSFNFSSSTLSNLISKHRELIRNGIKSDPYTGDFHSANSKLVFPEFDKYFTSDNPEDKAKAAKLRKIGKVIGLSLLFQDQISSAGYTVHYNSGVGDSPEEASKFTNAWYANVPKFIESIHRYMELATSKGYSVNMVGRKRWLPKAVNNDNYKLVRKLKALAINFPIQGSGADQAKYILHSSVKFIEEYKLNWMCGNLKADDSFYTHLLQIDTTVCDSSDSELLSILDSLPDGRTKILVGNDAHYDRLVSFSDEFLSLPFVKTIFSPTIS